MVYTFKTFHLYLAGARSGMAQVLSDHRSLKGIMDKPLDKIPTARLQGLWLKFPNYDFTISYVPAAKVILVDLLSRKPYMGARDQADEPEDYGCNAISLGCSSITLNMERRTMPTSSCRSFSFLRQSARNTSTL